jgi:hypothetical protein
LADGLIEADYHEGKSRPRLAQVSFWLREARTPHILIELCRRHEKAAKKLAQTRPLLQAARAGDTAALEKALREEEDSYRARDRAYWRPLRAELFELRQQTRRAGRRKPPVY